MKFQSPILLKKKTKNENENAVELIETEITNKYIKAIDRIQTQYKTFEYNLSQQQQYNPSPLVIRQTMNVFDDMYMKDEQIKASFNIKRQMILSNGFNIIVDDPEDEKQKEIRDFIWWTLNDGYGNVINIDLKQMLTALQYGVSITEKVYKVIDQGIHKGKIGLKYLLVRPPHGFEFFLSDYGDIEKIEQQGQSERIDVDPKKVIIYTFDKQFSNPFGLSDFTAVYTSYFMKAQLKKYMMIFAERFAINPIFGKYETGASDDTKTKLLNMVKNFQAKTAGIFEKGIEIETLKLDKKGSTDLFKQYIDLFNSMISRGFLLPELLGFTQHDTGSQSLGIEQFEMFLNTSIFPEQTLFEGLIDEKLIKEMVILNFGEQETYPKFQLNKPETKDKMKMYKIWIEAVSKGVVKSTIEDENIMRNEFGFSDREEEEGEGEDVVDDKKDIPNKDKEIDEDDDDKKEFVAVEDDLKFKRKMTEFEEKNVDLNNTVESFDNLEIRFANNLAKVVNDIRLYTENKVIKENMITDKNFQAINNFQLKSKQSKQLEYVFGKGLEDGYNQGIKDTKVNLKKAKKSAPAEFQERLTEMADSLQYTVGSLKPIEAINYLKNKKLTLANEEEAFILKNVKQMLNGGIANGKTESQVIAELEEYFQKYNVYQYNSKGELTDINAIKGRLPVIVRTNTNDAYNKGLFSTYNDPKVKDIIAALQYSAIFDDRTTDFCIGYDTRIYNANDAIWDWLNPPNHFACRSTTIPVFTFDTFEVSNKIALRPPEAFGGAA